MKLPSMNANNHSFIFAVAALAGVGGSVTTILLIASIVWAIVSLTLKRFPPAFVKSDLFLIVPALIYVLVQLTAMLLNAKTAGGGIVLSPREFVPLLPFLLFWLILPRLRVSDAHSLFESFVLGAAFCGILALPVSMWQAFVMMQRAEGGAGNALPFAMICALFSTFSLLNLLSDVQWRRAVGLIGFIAGFICLLLSQSRGLLPVPFLAAILFTFFFPAVIKPWFNMKGALVLGALLVLVALFGIGMADRIGEIGSYLISEGNDAVVDSSYTLRMDMWRFAGDLIQQNPIWGHGAQNRRALIQQIGLPFSHFHNGFITSLVDSGIVGFLSLMTLLCAPLLSSFNAAHNGFYKQRLFMALVLLAIYMIGGLTNFIFGHDIYDSVFLWSALIICVSLQKGHQEKIEGSVRGTTL